MAGHAVSSAMESSMCRTVLAMLRELEPSGLLLLINAGMLRWTLSNKVENSPALCVSLVRVLVKELERVSLFLRVNLMMIRRQGLGKPGAVLLHFAGRNGT
uniref:Uncharacterized protein n=1 Tax=Denticeps clupeoides TaxID=299321 RepID=A0AAY4CQK4_9TELE